MKLHDGHEKPCSIPTGLYRVDTFDMHTHERYKQPAARTQMSNNFLVRD